MFINVYEEIIVTGVIKKEKTLFPVIGLAEKFELTCTDDYDEILERLSDRVIN